jgi:hypothetical protein
MSMTGLQWFRRNGLALNLLLQCEICEARGCNGHGKNERETKAFSRGVDVSVYKDVAEVRL